jgi:hypothetical protein
MVFFLLFFRGSKGDLKKMRQVYFILLFLHICVYASTAHAVLGERVVAKSVDAKTSYSVSSDPSDRKKVKEFFDKSGNVFGACYDPRIAKDLTQVLGAKYSVLFAKSIKESNLPPRKGHPRIQTIKNSDLVIRSTKLGRSFSICVYDPQELPEGMSGNEIH